MVAAEEDSEAKKPTELIDDILKVSIMIRTMQCLLCLYLEVMSKNFRTVNKKDPVYA